MINKNPLHYYVNLLRMQEGEDRTLHSSNSCINALHNIIRTMKYNRHDRICDEDFTSLDFGNIPLNGVDWSNDGNNPCTFESSIINEWNFRCGHHDSVKHAFFSSDNRYLLTCSSDPFILIWNLQSGLIERKINVGCALNKAVAISADREYLIIGFYNGNIEIWNLLSGYKKMCFHPLSSEVTAVSLSNDEQLCILGTSDGTVILYDLKADKIRETLLEQKSKIISLDISPSDDYCVSCAEDGSVIFYNINSKLCTITSRYEYSNAFYVKFITNSKCILWSNKKIMILDLKSNTIKSVYDSPHSHIIDTIHLSFESKYFVVQSVDTTVAIVNADDGMIVQTLCEPPWGISTVAFSPDNRFCLTASMDKNMRLWDLRTGNCIKIFETFNSFILDAVFSCNGTHCLISSSNNEINLFDIINNQHVASLKDSKSHVIYSMDISENGNQCLIGGDHLLLWNTQDNTVIELNEEEIHAVAISKSGKYGFISTKKAAIMYDLETQNVLFTDDSGWDGTVYIMQDEKHCLIGRKDNRISVHQVKTGKTIHIIENVDQLVGYPRRITLSPSGNICLIIQTTINSSNHLENSIVRFINTFHNEVLYESNQQKGIVWFSSFLDSERICITSDLNISYIWDIESKRLVQQLPSPMIVGYSAHISRPPYYMLDNSGEVEIHRISQKNQSEYEYRKIAVIYNYNSLKVKKCRFTNIIAPDSVCKALSQYCVET